jgi:hypothetical protein
MEITVRDFVLEKLRRAKNGLRRNSIDELEALVAFCQDLPREDWPPELAAFVRRRFERGPDGRLVFKRPPHRMRSRRRAFARWFHDPNHIVELRRARDRANAQHDWQAFEAARKLQAHRRHEHHRGCHTARPRPV